MKSNAHITNETELWKRRILFILLLFQSIIKPKAEQTGTEISMFESGNDDSSLGSRFSMWRIGVTSFKTAPWGQSLEARNSYAKTFVANNPKYKTALVYIGDHLHNEFLQTLSLQGIIGGISLLCFHLSIMIGALRHHNTILLSITACMVIYGLTDVILLSPEALCFFLGMIALFSQPRLE